MKAFLLKMIKFGAVGTSGLLIDFSLTYVLKEKINTPKYVANGCGFLCAAGSNFTLNKIWTFENTQNDFLSQYILYLCIALGGLAINQLALYALHGRMNIGFYIAKGGATLVTIAWNFTLNYSITFA